MIWAELEYRERGVIPITGHQRSLSTVVKHEQHQRSLATKGFVILIVPSSPYHLKLAILSLFYLCNFYN